MGGRGSHNGDGKMDWFLKWLWEADSAGESVTLHNRVFEPPLLHFSCLPQVVVIAAWPRRYVRLNFMMLRLHLLRA